MKKLTAIFFLLFLSISQVGHLLVYYVQLWQIRNTVEAEILAGMPERFCTVIEYNNDIRWEEPGKEFRMNDELYDVVVIKKNHGKTLIYCLNDRNEEQLVKNFSNILTSSSGHEKDTGNHYAVKFHVTDQYIMYAVSPFLFSHAIGVDHICLQAALSTQSGEIYIPPPRNLIS